MTEDLRKAVEENRMNYIYRNEYIRQQVALEDARDEGREEGRKIEKLNLIISMIKSGCLTIEDAVQDYEMDRAYLEEGLSKE